VITGDVQSARDSLVKRASDLIAAYLGNSEKVPVLGQA
jgi:hypothetical protein